MFSSAGTDSSVEAREKRRYEAAGAAAGLCFEKRGREVGVTCLTHAQIDLNFTVEFSLRLGGVCGWWRLASYCVFSQSLFFPACLITDRLIFAFCDEELEAQRKIFCFVLSFL